MESGGERSNGHRRELALMIGVVTGMQITALRPRFFDDMATPCGVERNASGEWRRKIRQGLIVRTGGGAQPRACR